MTAGRQSGTINENLRHRTSRRDLLARFAAGRAEAAFAELVHRHGPAVLGVCRRAAGYREDAEDASQAALVVLARKKAGAVENPDALGPWLRGVAYRVALRARRSATRRRKREVQVPDVPHPPATGRTPDPGAAAVVEAKVAALLDCRRAAVLLCAVAGPSRADAAARRGVPEGTLSSPDGSLAALAYRRP